MVIIDFPNGSSWYRANWIYREIVEDVVRFYSADPELVKVFKKGSAYGYINVPALSDDLKEKVMLALRTIAQMAVSGQLPGTYAPSKDGPMPGWYEREMTLLLELMGG